MPFDSTTSQDLAQYEAYVCTDEGAAIARAVVQSTGGSSAALHGGGLSGAARLASDVATAQIIIAEIGNIPVDMACECVTELRKTGAHVIVLGDQTDIATYRALLKAGATEYFSFPVAAEDILAAKTERPAPTEQVVVELPKPIAKNPSIAVLGSNGGVGASLLVQNLAFHASLDRDETTGLFDALMTPSRLDETFISATMDHITDRLSMYSNQVRIGQDALPYEGGLPGIYDPLRAEFDAVITDLPRETLMRREDLAHHIDALVLVIPAGFSGVNAATRLIERITERNPDVRILPVLSEVRKDAGLSRKDIEKTLARKLIATLPRSDAPMSKAHRAAKPLVEIQPRGPYTKAVADIWTAAMSAKRAPDQPATRPLMKKLFG